MESAAMRSGPDPSSDAEVSAARENWPEVAHKEDNKEVNGGCFTGRFAAVDGGEVRTSRKPAAIELSEWLMIVTFGNGQHNVISQTKAIMILFQSFST
jgi:hypothetical protein